jgi:hypothetical protein
LPDRKFAPILIRLYSDQVQIVNLAPINPRNSLVFGGRFSRNFQLDFMSSDLESVFAELGLSQYLGSFVEQGFDEWDIILDIQESDL